MRQYDANRETKRKARERSLCNRTLPVALFLHMLHINPLLMKDGDANCSCPTGWGRAKISESGRNMWLSLCICIKPIYHINFIIIQWAKELRCMDNLFFSPSVRSNFDLPFELLKKKYLHECQGLVVLHDAHIHTMWLSWSHIKQNRQKSPKPPDVMMNR